MKRGMSRITVVVGATIMAGVAMAATETGDLTVQATVNNACAIGPGTLDFGTLALEVQADGTVSGTNHNADSGSTISIACTNGASAAVTGGNGQNYSSGRRMISGSDYLGYELYTSTARDTVLNTTNSISYTGTGAATTDTVVYGRVTAAQLAAAKKGSYSDTVVLTITYTP